MKVLQRALISKTVPVVGGVIGGTCAREVSQLPSSVHGRLFEVDCVRSRAEPHVADVDAATIMARFGRDADG